MSSLKLVMNNGVLTPFENYSWIPYQAKLWRIISCSSFVCGSLVILKSSFSVYGHLKEICLSDNYFYLSPSRGSRFRFCIETVVLIRALFELALFCWASLNLLGDLLCCLSLLLWNPPRSEPFTVSTSLTVAGVSKLNPPFGLANGVHGFLSEKLFIPFTCVKVGALPYFGISFFGVFG